MRREILAEGVECYLGDMREILPTLGTFDACLTDPPYGIGASKGIGDTGKRDFGEQSVGDWDSSAPTTAVFDLIRERSTVQIMWGGNYFPLPPSRKFLVWDKGNSMRGRDFAEGEFAWCSFDGNAKILTLDPMNRQGSTKQHPTEKPLPLMTWCLAQLPADARTILDPFMGSGTTGVACAKRGFSFAGIEREPKYFDIACRRISDALSRPDLFIERPAAPKQEALL